MLNYASMRERWPTKQGEDAHVYGVHEAETTIITTNIKINNNEKFSLLAIKKTEPENIGHE